jgi:hypothetical protein
MLNTHEVMTERMAMVWLNALLRLEKIQIKKNAAKGGTGMSQVRVGIDSINAPVNFGF